jgi:hypothetical protein
MYVRITQTPPGEAPIEVRQKWVGLVLPVVPGRHGPYRALTSGVLTGPKSFLGRLRDLLLGRFSLVDGYPVDAAAAVEVLAQHHPDAADWWRTANRLRPGGTFLFHSHVCEPLSDSK